MHTFTPATSPWAWRIRKADNTDDERFVIAFIYPDAPPSETQWTSDGIARTEDEARAYALEYGVSPGAFTDALKSVRRGAAVPSRPPSS